jgi:hypothetical protein
MKIQHLSESGAGGGDNLNVQVTWLTPDMIRLAFIRSSDAQEYYLSPQELAKISDHINDVLCR